MGFLGVDSLPDLDLGIDCFLKLFDLFVDGLIECGDLPSTILVLILEKESLSIGLGQCSALI